LVSDAVDRFIDALRADPYLADCADPIARAMSALDREAEECSASSADAAGLYECLVYVLGHPRYLLREKLDKCIELVHRRGRQEGTIREIVGWR
jgi:hypothetical protein